MNSLLKEVLKSHSSVLTPFWSSASHLISWISG